jgi:uncharacterized protein
MREKIYNKLSRIIIKHNGKVLLAIAAVTLVQIYLLTGLGIKNQLSDMMPENVPQVESFNEIVKDFTSDAQIMITVKSTQKNEKRMIEAAEKISVELDRIIHLYPSSDQDLTFKQRWDLYREKENVEGVRYDSVNFVKRIDVKLDTGFFRNHGAVIQENKDLKNFIEMYSRLDLNGILKNINDNFEKEFVGDSENLSTIDGEAQAVAGLNNIFSFVSSLGDYIADGDTLKVRNSVSKFIIGDEYIFSPDREMLLISLLPAVSTSDFDNLLIMAELLENKMRIITAGFPDLEFALAGTPVIGYQEQTAIMNDFGWSTLAALLIVMLIVVGSFRSWKHPLFSILTLSLSVIWVAGILAVTLKYLNTMSAAFGVMLIGLGIDFAIHFLSGYRDAIDHGDDPEKAIGTMYLTVGNGVLTGGLTTAMVFFTLIFIGFRAFGEMGFAMGVGILTTLISMFVLLPALIVRENRKKTGVKSGSVIPNNIIFRPVIAVTELMQFRFMEKIGKISARPSYIATVIILSIVFTLYSIYGANKLEYEYDMTQLEPKNMPAIEAQEEIIKKFEISPDFAMFTVNSLDSARSKVEQIKRLADRSGLIGRVDCISEYFQPEEVQLKNQEPLTKYREMIRHQEINSGVSEDELEKITAELERLHYNVVEIGELSVMSKGEKNKIITKTDEIAGRTDDNSRILNIRDKLLESDDPTGTVTGFQEAYVPHLRQLLYNITDTTLVSFDTFPQYIKERFYNPETGKYLISIYPKKNIWEERNLRRFHEQTSNIDPRITGMPVLMLIFIDIMKDKGSLSVFLGSLVIVLLLLLDFRSVKYTIMALLPLAAGSLWMLGLMYLFGMKLNINNYMALPIIIGIGIDDGVHILHRYMIEGRNSIAKVTKFTGKAILLTSLTTMISFGSIGMASHRGLASMGIVLVLGVGSCFISSAFLLPALISLMDMKAKNGSQK